MSSGDRHQEKRQVDNDVTIEMIVHSRPYTPPRVILYGRIAELTQDLTEDGPIDTEFGSSIDAD